VYILHCAETQSIFPKKNDPKKKKRKKEMASVLKQRPDYSSVPIDDLSVDTDADDSTPLVPYIPTEKKAWVLYETLVIEVVTLTETITNCVIPFVWIRDVSEFGWVALYLLGGGILAYHVVKVLSISTILPGVGGALAAIYSSMLDTRVRKHSQTTFFHILYVALSALSYRFAYTVRITILVATHSALFWSIVIPLWIVKQPSLSWVLIIVLLCKLGVFIFLLFILAHTLRVFPWRVAWNT